jgi:manganese-dependent inorganic pyrophosphatase
MFEQVKLEYGMDALEPVIDTLTVETHYGKHHAAYTKVFNELAEKAGLDGKSAEELFKTDYKQFHISGQNIGVSQITSADAEHVLERRDEFLAFMEKEKTAKAYDLVILMVTDVLKEGSYLLYIGNDDTIQQAFGVEPENKQVFLPGVMSRKKQIIPMLTALWG